MNNVVFSFLILFSEGFLLLNLHVPPKPAQYRPRQPTLLLDLVRARDIRVILVSMAGSVLPKRPLHCPLLAGSDGLAIIAAAGGFAYQHGL